MNFRHANTIWDQYPQLAAGAIAAEGITPSVDVGTNTERHYAAARERLGDQPESALPEIQAWRRTFSAMGLKPTQYRCASESLLRRFRKEGDLPSIHPLIDLCNTVSLAYATPIAVFDRDHITGDLQVRHADGSERYLTFGGEIEHPDSGEVIFADDDGAAHARRWTNRQSGRSAVRDDTAAVLIVAEAMHDSAPADMLHLIEHLRADLQSVWSITPRTSILSASEPVFST